MASRSPRSLWVKLEALAWSALWRLAHTYTCTFWSQECLKCPTDHTIFFFFHSLSGNLQCYDSQLFMQILALDKLSWVLTMLDLNLQHIPLIAWFAGPTGADRTQAGPMLAPWILLSGTDIHTGKLLRLHLNWQDISSDRLHLEMWGEAATILAMKHN